MRQRSAWQWSERFTGWLKNTKTSTEDGTPAIWNLLTNLTLNSKCRHRQMRHAAAQSRLSLNTNMRGHGKGIYWLCFKTSRDSIFEHHRQFESSYTKLEKADQWGLKHRPSKYHVLRRQFIIFRFLALHKLRDVMLFLFIIKNTFKCNLHVIISIFFFSFLMHEGIMKKKKS